jgi:hypothetical protein
MVKWEDDKNVYILAAALAALNATITNEIAQSILNDWRKSSLLVSLKLSTLHSITLHSITFALPHLICSIAIAFVSSHSASSQSSHSFLSPLGPVQSLPILFYPTSPTPLHPLSHLAISLHAASVYPLFILIIKDFTDVISYNYSCRTRRKDHPPWRQGPAEETCFLAFYCCLYHHCHHYQEVWRCWCQED